jgi:hypothetical protein
LLVLRAAAVDAYRLAQVLRLLGHHRQIEQAFDFVFRLVRQLAAAGVEKFDAVVLVRVVRSADDDTEAALEALRRA